MASEYLKKKYQDVKPDAPRELTAAERRKNWWYYHKWHMAAVLVLLAAAGSILWDVLSQVEPDYQLAYIGAAPLSEETENAWRETLTALGGDCNGDNKILVQVNQYLSTPEDPMYAAAGSIKLMADLESNESYFFLLADPEGFQAGYEVLREDWFPVGDGLYLARRSFWEGRTPENLEGCDALWEKLVEEMG